MESCHCEDKAACTCGSPIVCMKSVTFRRGTRTIIDDVSLCVHEGVFVGVIGPNGGGKTTLLRLILGSLRASSGAIQLFGRPINQLGAERAQIGYLPQRNTLDPDFPATALDVVLMGAIGRAGLLRRINPEARKSAVKLLDRVGVGELADRPIGRMSGGQQQRTLIARALLCNPRLLIMDEPTAGLDSAGQQQFLHFVRELQKEFHLTILMVSHDVGQLAYYSDQIACINVRLHWHDRSALLSDDIIRGVYECRDMHDCELDAYRERIREFVD